MPDGARRGARVALLLAFALLAGACSGERERGSGPVAGLVRYASDSEPRFPDVALTARRNRYVILNFYEHDLRRALKAANPELKVLVYKNAGAISSSGQGTRYSAGVGFEQADSEHPEWFLTNTEGDRFTFSRYPWLWAADIGDRGYQDAWAANTIAELEEDGWDGVFMDDASYTIDYQYDAASVAEYPTDAEYGAAMRSMLANVGPKLRDAGKLAFANLQLAEFPSHSRDWVQFLDGAMDEVFVKSGHAPGEGYSDPERWADQLENLKDLERRDKTLLAITQANADEVEAMRFGWATALLGGEGRVAFELHQDGTNELYYEEYGYDLGAPLGDASVGDGGVHRREFERGLVLVNPTAEAQEADFGGTYDGSGLTAASSASMPPHTGLILTAR